MRTIWTHRRAIAVAVLTGTVLGYGLGRSRGLPFVAERTGWSIGIYGGASPLELVNEPRAANPVLTAEDVTDVPAQFVADPFMVVEENNYCMFFEVLNRKTRQGDIGLATSPDGRTWHYQRIVLDEPFHLSYPYVFRHEGRYYMTPETHEDSSVRLYRATRFPTEWTLEGTLLSGYDFTDPSVFRSQDRWWLFCSSTRHDFLRLFVADDLTGPWHEHPQSPLVVRDPNIARPAGRVLDVDGTLFRLAQDDHPRYGLSVNAFEIKTLSPSVYEEAACPGNPVLRGTGAGWNALGMHHVDAHRVPGSSRWVACVDGEGSRRVFGLVR